MSKASLSIRSRLVRVVVTSIFGGVLASVTFFTVSDFRQSVFAEQARLRSSAAAFAAAAAEGVKSQDARAVLLVLRAIRELPDVLYAAAYDHQGRSVAELGQATELVGRDGSIESSSLLAMLAADTLSVTVDIHDSGAVIGSVAFVADISGLRTQYLRSFGVSLAVGFLLILVTAVIARRQVGRVVAPLGALAADFADIGRRSDLTHRAEKVRDDEVGVLVDAFNEMFSLIERRDILLQRHRETLEETVETRTTELRIAKDDAERANAAKSDFLATMSHEIRTPMNGMLVMAEMLSAAPLAPRHLRYAEIISRSGKSLLNIINDILDYSKIEAGKLTFEAIPFSLDTLIEDAASLFAERAREKGLTIAIFVSRAVPAKLTGDPTRLSQVIGNLLNNGLKFTETGGVTIEADWFARADGRAGLEVHVRDTGVGITSDKLGRIFERFSQADQSITRRFGGTGLGLSISRRLVEGMGGEIRVTSEPGKGSDFSFLVGLPIAEKAPVVPDLTGHRVAIRCNELTRNTLAKAFTERGATVVEQGQELTVVDATGFTGDLRGPCVFVREFAGTSIVQGDMRLLAELAAPVRRYDLDVISRGLISGEWSFGNRSATGESESRLPDLRHLKVLAVDDTAVNREVLAEALGAFKIVAELAGSGVEAIERIAAKPFDFIFMDCSMPEMDGYEATARIRKIEGATGRKPSRIVALTAHVTGDEAQRWRNAGMDAYVAKPFTIAQIHAVLTAQQVTAAPVSDMADAPVLAPESLAMFCTLSGPMAGRLADKVFGLFLDHAPVALENLRTAHSDGSGDVAALAHALKSMCASAGAARAASLCEQIERKAKTGDQVTPEDLSALDDVLCLTYETMKTYLTSLIEKRSLAG